MSDVISQMHWYSLAVKYEDGFQYVTNKSGHILSYSTIEGARKAFRKYKDKIANLSILRIGNKWVPTEEPRQVIVMYNTSDGHNKEYRMTEQDDGTFLAEWGPVGKLRGSKVYPMHSWETIKQSKLDKGYYLVR